MKNNKNIPIIITVAVLIAIATVTWFSTERNKGANGSGGTTVSQPSSNQSTSSTPSTTSTNTTKQPTPSSGVTGNLIAPTGSFVSNHHPNLSGSPAPNQEQSVCNTTPGATCDIEFTNNGITKSLGAKTADSSGATYWTWTLQSIGLAHGSWKITAKATLNNQTKTAIDALLLDVQP